MQCFTLTPKWPRMLLDFNLLWFLILCIVFDTGRLLYRSIFTSFAPATQQKKYIYIYMNIKPIFTSTRCHFMLLFSSSFLFLDKAFCRSCHYLWRAAVWLSWSLPMTHTVCEWFPVCFFGCVSFCFPVFGWRYLKGYTVERLRTWRRIDTLHLKNRRIAHVRSNK